MTIIYQPIRQRVIRKTARLEAVLGNGSGSVYASKTRYWVRVAMRADSDGNMTYGQPLPMRYAPGYPIIEKEGVEVLLFYDHDGELSIERMKTDYFDRADIDSRSFNSASPQDQWLYLRNVVRFLTRPVGSSATEDSTLITVRENPFFVDDVMDFYIYAGTTSAASKPDLASYIPAADYQRLICIFFDTKQQEPFVAGSTTQALTTAIDSTDLTECFAQLEHNEYIPLLSLVLSNNQSAIVIDNVKEDLRQFVNAPRVYGFPNPIASGQAILIRDTHQEMVYDLTVQGNLTIQGDLVNL